MTMLALKKFKGTRGPRSTERWSPKRWKPSYDVIVGLWATGKFTQIEIASFLSLHKVLVCNVLNCEAAIPYIAAAREKIKGKVEDDFSKRLDALSNRALLISEKIMSDDALVEKYPLSMLEKSIKLLEATKKIGKHEVVASNNTTNNNLIVVPADQMARLSEGFEKLEEIKRIHGSPTA